MREHILYYITLVSMIFYVSDLYITQNTLCRCYTPYIYNKVYVFFSHSPFTMLKREIYRLEKTKQTAKEEKEAHCMFDSNSFFLFAT